MNPNSLTDTRNANPLSTGAQDGGWRRIETADDGIGPTKGDPLPKTISRLPRPKILTQRKGIANSVPINLHRKGIGVTMYPENPTPAAYVGLGQPTSQGVGQYYYAPGEGNLTKNPAFRSGLILAEVGRGGGGPAMLDEVGGRDGQWSDTDLAVELGKDGYPRYDWDTNLARRPKTWRFRTKDRDVSMFPQRNQTSSPEAPSQFDIGNESLFYPLTSSVLGRGKKSKRRQAAKRAFKKMKPEEPPKKEDPPKTEDQVAKELAKKSEEAAGAKPEAKGAKVGDTVRWSDEEVKHNPKDPSVAQKRGKVVSEKDGMLMVDWGDGKPAPAEPQQVVPAEGGAPAEDQAPIPQGAPAQKKADIRQLAEQIYEALGDDAYLDLVNNWFAQSPKEQNDRLEEVIEKFPDVGPEDLKRAVSHLASGAGGWTAPQKESGYFPKKLPTDMTPQERLFRNVGGWTDNYQMFSDKDITPAIQKVLEAKPEGEGKYFDWQYEAPGKDGKGALVVVIRKQPWIEFQEAA